MSSLKHEAKQEAKDEDKPPFFRTWNGVYALVIGVLAALVVLFSILSAIYR